MTLKKGKIILEISPETVMKLNVIGEEFIDEANITETVEKIINNRYEEIIEGSEGRTVKELIAEKIEEIKEYNEANKIMNINKTMVKQVKNFELKNVIKGAIMTCPIEDDIVMSHKIEKDVKINRYLASSGSWTASPSYILHIKTNKGEYVYISALNTIKTKEKYEEYVTRKQIVY